jgi:hypothetical protein
MSPPRSLNTFFGREESSNNAYRFFGTSAAAPNVAAIALLMLQANPDLKPLEVYEILEETAIDMNDEGFDFESGHGFVNALAAVTEARKNSKIKKKIKRSKTSKNAPEADYCTGFTDIDGDDDGSMTITRNLHEQKTKSKNDKGFVRRV